MSTYLVHYRSAVEEAFFGRAWITSNNPDALWHWQSKATAEAEMEDMKATFAMGSAEWVVVEFKDKKES